MSFWKSFWKNIAYSFSLTIIANSLIFLPIHQEAQACLGFKQESKDTLTFRLNDERNIVHIPELTKDVDVVEFSVEINNITTVRCGRGVFIILENPLPEGFPIFIKVNGKQLDQKNTICEGGNFYSYIEEKNPPEIWTGCNFY